MDPVGRAALAFLIVLGFELAIKAPWAFDSDWNPRPWNQIDDSGDDTTSVPWWLLPGGSAVIAGVFI